jgi:hypothetical protein
LLAYSKEINNAGTYVRKVTDMAMSPPPPIVPPFTLIKNVGVEKWNFCSGLFQAALKYEFTLNTLCFVLQILYTVNTANRLQAGRMRKQGLTLGRGKACSLLHNIQMGSGAHSASYQMGMGGKATGV